MLDQRPSPHVRPPLAVPSTTTTKLPGIGPKRRCTTKWKHSFVPIVYVTVVVVSGLLSWYGTLWTMDIISSPGSSEGTREFMEPSIESSSTIKPAAAVPPHHPSNHTTKQNSMAATTTTATFSACLLIKDDSDILNEWIAYHYHVLNLRTIILAIDPSSQTSPTPLLDRWRQDPWDMTILEWNDVDYLPTFFLQGQYDQVPGFVPHSATTSVWHRHSHNLTLEQVEADLQQINLHRFRQATFVSRCFRHLKQEHYQQQKRQRQRKGKDRTLPSWTLHIDTDEYVVVNPGLRLRPKAVTGVLVPQVPFAGSLVHFLFDMYRVWPKRLFKSCLTMPTLLFGAVEKNHSSSSPLILKNSPNISRFETLRWTVHAALDDPISGLPKAMIDVSTLPEDHPIFVQDRIKSVHQPLDSSYPTTNHQQICRRLGHIGSVAKQWQEVRLYPLSIQHYVGSKERYFSRKDVRRNVQIYQDKASVHGGVDDGWIQGWWPSFIETHGAEATNSVLQNYVGS